MGNAYVYVQYITGTCIRADIYIFNAPEAGSAYMYTCKDITGICIRAKIYILWLIIYYLILLNLTLANPHTELAMARLSSPANTTTIADNITPRVATLQLQGTETWGYTRGKPTPPPLLIFSFTPLPPPSL